MTKIYRRLIIGVTLAISAFLLASCGQTQSPKEKKELTVMTTFIRCTTSQNKSLVMRRG